MTKVKKKKKTHVANCISLFFRQIKNKVVCTRMYCKLKISILYVLIPYSYPQDRICVQLLNIKFGTDGFLHDGNPRLKIKHLEHSLEIFGAPLYSLSYVF